VSGGQEHPDGRVRRGRRNRDAVVGALLGLVEDGDIKPTADAIAARAGLSRRSVFQHFADLEAIYEEAGIRTWLKISPLFGPLDTGAPLPERITRFVSTRGEIFELIDPFARSARLREPFSAQLRANRKMIVGRLFEQCRQAFEPELSADPGGDPDLATALSVATSWAVWDFLRVDLDLDAEQVLALMGRTVAGLLADAGARQGPRRSRRD
jgi:TetR/AcrR family transcriptional regulator, regulator of autoinduction and epiphytic fitness